MERWTILTAEQKLDADPSGTAIHDSLIVKFNHLARYMELQGLSSNWRNEL